MLNMSRMIGFALGIAICVALLSSFTPTHVSDAQAEVRAIVMEDQQIPASIKERILTEVEHVGEQQGPQSVPDIAAIAAEMGAPEAILPHLEQLSGEISSIFSTHVARAFRDVFPLAAVVGGLSIIPALFLRRPIVAPGGGIHWTATAG